MEAEIITNTSLHGAIPCYKLNVEEYTTLGEFSKLFMDNYSVKGDINLKMITRKEDGKQIIILIS